MAYTFERTTPKLPKSNFERFERTVPKKVEKEQKKEESVSLLEYFESGFLGRFAKGLGEATARGVLTLQGEGDLVDTIEAARKAEEEAKSKEVVPGIGESLAAFGDQLISHPLDALGELVYEMGKDPELLLPSLWTAMPAKLATIVAKGGTLAKVGATGVRGAGIGAIAETGAEIGDPEFSPEKIGHTAGMFGVMGAGAHGALELGTKGVKKFKERTVTTEEKPTSVEDDFAKYRTEPKEKPVEEPITKPIEEVKEVVQEEPKQPSALVSKPKYFLDSEEAYASLRDRDTAMSQGEIDRIIEKENRTLRNEYEDLREISKPTVEESLRLDDVRDKMSLNALRIDPKNNLKPFIEELKEDLNYLTNENEYGPIDSYAEQRIAKIKKLLSELNEFEVKATQRITGLESPVIEGELTTKKLPSELVPEQKTAIETKVVAEEATAEQLHPSTLKEGIEIVKGTARDIRADTRQAKIFAEEIRTLVPDERLRTLMTRAIEKERKYDKLYTDKERSEMLDKMSTASEKMQYNLETDRIPKGMTRESYQQKLDRLNFVIERLKSIGSQEHAIPVLERIKNRLEEIGNKAIKAGLIDSLRENYITHILDFSKSKLNPVEQKALLEKLFGVPKESKLVKDFTQQRKYEFLRELEKAVKDTGVVVHTDIATIVEAYEKSMQTAIAHKKMIDHFSKTLAPNKKPWLVPLTKEALKEGYVPFQGRGSRPLEGLVVHPDLVDVMKFMFEQNDPDLVLRALGGVSHLTKSLNTVGSLFHAYSLATAAIMTAPLKAGPEIAKLIFTKGGGIRQAVEAYRKGGIDDATIDGFIRNGLLAETEDIQRTIIAESGRTVDQLISRFAPKGKEFKIVQRATDPLDQHVLQKLNKFTWDYMHAGMKMNMAMHLYSKAKAKNPHIPDAQLQKEVSSYINNTFGGLDWLEVASQVNNKYLQAFAMKAANIRGRAWGQVILFAPDWTVSTLRAFTTALPKEIAKPKNWQLREGVQGIYNPKTQGDFARRYVLNTAVAYFTILNGFNMAFSGHPMWENKDITRIDMGDGTSVQAAKHSMEALEWLHNPEKTLGNKLGFWPKAAVVSTVGVAYPSPDAPKLQDTSLFGRAKAVGLLGAPFQVSAGMQAPEGQGLKRAVTSTLGIPVYGMTREERSKAIKEGKEQKRKELEEKFRTNRSKMTEAELQRILRRY